MGTIVTVVIEDCELPPCLVTRPNNYDVNITFTPGKSRMRTFFQCLVDGQISVTWMLMAVHREVMVCFCFVSHIKYFVFLHTKYKAPRTCFCKRKQYFNIAFLLMYYQILTFCIYITIKSLTASPVCWLVCLKY